MRRAWRRRARASGRCPEITHDARGQYPSGARLQAQARLVEVERRVAAFVLDDAREHRGEQRMPGFCRSACGSQSASRVCCSYPKSCGPQESGGSCGTPSTTGRLRSKRLRRPRWTAFGAGRLWCVTRCPSCSRRRTARRRRDADLDRTSRKFPDACRRPRADTFRGRNFERNSRRCSADELRSHLRYERRGPGGFGRALSGAGRALEIHRAGRLAHAARRF
jgi:hypothetical protein